MTFILFFVKILVTGPKILFCGNNTEKKFKMNFLTWTSTTLRQSQIINVSELLSYKTMLKFLNIII